MFLTTHAIVGVALGGTQPTLVRGLLLSLVSHYVLDAIPHSEHLPVASVLRFMENPRGSEGFRLLSLAIVDGLIGLTLSLLIFWPSNFYEAINILLLAGVSMIPDALTGLYVYSFPSKLVTAHFKFHQFFHFLILERHWLQEHRIIGLLVQALLAILVVYCISIWT